MVRATRFGLAAHIADWSAQEEKIGRFWRNAMLYQRSYDDNPIQMHKVEGNVKVGYFPAWLSLFDAVLNQELPPALAQAWSALAHRIGRGLSYARPTKHSEGRVPDLGGTYG